MIHRRTDYLPPAFIVEQVMLDVHVAAQTRVTARLSMRRAPDVAASPELRLDARALTVQSVALR